MKWLSAFSILVCLNVNGEALLRVRPHIVVSPNSDVMLGQLVDAQGLSPEFPAQIRAIALSKSPDYGEKQEIANANLTSILRPIIQAERARTKGTIHVVIPKVVTIDTTKHEMEKDLVLSELLQTWQPQCVDCQLDVEALSLPRVAGIKDWTLRLKPELPRGSFSVPVDLVREDGSLTSAWISGRLLTKRKVPVAKRVLNLSDRVTAQDFDWEFRDTSYAIDGIPTGEDFAGQKLRQGLRAGDILWRGMLEKEKAVRRGDLVQLKSFEGSWEVSMRVISEQDGYIGDVINMRNPKTNNVLMGKVVRQGEVELR